MPDYWTLSGWIVGVLGLFVALVQYRKTKRITDRNREQMMIFLDRANFVSFEHELLDEVTSRLDGDHLLIRHLSTWHQAGCDLYIMMVDYYLSQEPSFGWKDLENLCKTPVITYRWQEEKWRALLLLRHENKKSGPPDELYLKSAKTQRTWSYNRSRRDGEGDGD